MVMFRPKGPHRMGGYPKVSHCPLAWASQDLSRSFLIEVTLPTVGKKWHCSKPQRFNDEGMPTPTIIGTRVLWQLWGAPRDPEDLT